MSSLLEESHIVDPTASSSSGAVSGPAPPPVPTFTLRQVIGGRETEMLVQTYDDRIVLIITQNGKIGCMTQASLPSITPLTAPSSTSPTPFPPPPASISLTPLLGSPPAPTLHALYVSQLATMVWWALELGGGKRRPVVVGLALVGMSKEGGDGGDEVDGSGSGERERFLEVMKMVAAWPGP